MTPAHLRAISAYADIDDLMDKLERDAQGVGPEASIARQAFNGLYELRLSLGLQIERMCSGRQADVWARTAPSEDIEAVLQARVVG